MTIDTEEQVAKAGFILRTKREELGLTGRDVERRARNLPGYVSAITQQALSRIELGTLRKTPNAQYLAQIAEIYGVDVSSVIKLYSGQAETLTYPALVTRNIADTPVFRQLLDVFPTLDEHEKRRLLRSIESNLTEAMAASADKVDIANGWRT